MTLRITPSGPGPPAVLTLDGRLTGDEVAELRRAVDEVGGKVILDLTGLQFADRPGVSVLRELKAHGAKFTGCSPYMRLLLDDAPHDATN
jgi:anti-anti-sigma regulatory factor